MGTEIEIGSAHEQESTISPPEVNVEAGADIGEHGNAYKRIRVPFWVSNYLYLQGRDLLLFLLLELK
jgi:hypothetical protein